jgi:hypothetical protein
LVAVPAFSRVLVAPAGELAAHAARAAGPCDTLAAIGPYRPSLLFYARRPVTFVGRARLRDDPRLAELSAAPGRLFVIAPAALRGTLPASLSVLEARGGYVLLASDWPARGCVA